MEEREKRWENEANASLYVRPKPAKMCSHAFDLLHILQYHCRTNAPQEAIIASESHQIPPLLTWILLALLWTLVHSAIFLSSFSLIFGVGCWPARGGPFCEWEYLFFLVVRVGVPENRQDGTSSNVAGCLLAGCRSVDFGFQLQTWGSL